MNAKQLISLAALAIAAGSALADDITLDNSAAVASTRSRAEVKAETRQALRAGELLAAGEENFGVTSERSLVARASVKAEVLAARANDALIPAGELLAVAHPVRRGDTFRSNTLAALR
ncbi:hypothetical protein [Ideonella sp. BN130291]|uniref:hypothetical protein n=1 Tax=Ideonella sp. BN130291 TaxID=3112940 RepID=UPI002E2567EF|nr:hypothetical protein [Ideonella sp. BN130291]